jgi:argininosuccinate lyase
MKLWKGRFEEEADPVFEKMNRSLGLDAVLLAVDIQASRAHARALLGCGVLDETEWHAIDRGLEEILSEYTPEQVKAMPYEDVHTFVEATLFQKIGTTGQKLHTGRSRNDQVATDFRLFLKKAIALLIADIETVQHTLLESAATYSSVLLPAYTHLRRAQPIKWSHYCLAFVDMLARDRERFDQSLGRVDVLPLGSGAVAGSNFNLDRASVARELGFAKLSTNSLDATCDRDFVAEFLANSAMLLTHASRLAEDWIIYSTDEFGFIELSEKVTSGSSLMPQKKNPDGLELIRAKAGVISGTLAGFLSVMKGLPTGYNKDLQEDKAAFLSTFENVRLSLSVLRLTIRTAQLRTERMTAAASDAFMGATDLADYLVTKGIPFRASHEIVARAVRAALEREKGLDDIDLTEFSALFADLPPDYLMPESIVARKSLTGGTGHTRS